MSDYTTVERDQLRELMHAANDKLRATKAAYFQERATYDDLKADAVQVLELRCEIERRCYGRVKLNRRATLASLMR